MGKKQTPLEGAITTIPTVQDLYNSSLDPITNLPVKQEKIIPPDITNSYDLYNSVNPGTHSGETRVPTVSEVNYYGQDDVTWDVKDPSRLEFNKAARQTGMEQFGGFLNQMVIGEVFGGTIQGVGALFDIGIDAVREVVTGGEDGINSITDEDKSFWADQDYSNSMTAFGASLTDWSKKSTPIYTTSTKGWNPSDSGWWYSNGVSVASTLSLMIPGYASVKAAGMLGRSFNKVGRYLAGAAGVTNTNKVRKLFSTTRAIAQSRRGQQALNATIMGTSMRHMENFREAGETYELALEKNYHFLTEGDNFEKFLNSAEGQNAIAHFGGDPNISIEQVSNYIAGSAASKSYQMNWANVGFDILQSALFLGRGRILGTRARATGPVSKAQNSILKVPLGPTTNLGKGLAFTKRAVLPWAAWSYSEGMEEQWNFISMQEGIRKGDVMSGNTGWQNEDFMNGGFGSRINQYFNDPELWSATLFGSIGGGVFTSISNIKNMKAQRAMDEARIKEIGSRSELIQRSMQKRQEALARGDMQAVEEQDNLMGMTLAIEAAAVGNVNLLIEMINDPGYAEVLENNGVSKDDIQNNKNQLISIIEKTEKTFQKYSNMLTEDKWGPGAALALTQLESTVNLYDSLIKSTEQKLTENTENDVYSKEQFNIGPNTKTRYEAMNARKALQSLIDKYTTIRTRAAEQSQDTTLTEAERKQATEVMEQVDGMITPFKEQLSEIEKSEIKLRADSQENYDTQEYALEEKFLNDINTGSEQDLIAKMEQYKNIRDSSWLTIQKILNGETIKTRDPSSKKTQDTSFNSSKENENSPNRDLVSINNSEEISKSAMNSAILDDYKELVRTNPNLTQEQTKEFFAQYPDNQEIQDQAQQILNSQRQADINRTISDQIDDLYIQGNEALTDVRSSIEEKVEQLKKELFDPKISRREEARRVRIEKLFRESNAEAAKSIYGQEDSFDYFIDEIFDEFTTVVPVVWGTKVGAIYRDTQTGELIFREGINNKEYIVQENIESKEMINLAGQVVNKPNLGYLDMLMLRQTNYNIDIQADGRTYNIEGEYYNNLNSDPTSAIEYDKEANVVSVTLLKWDGKKATFTSPSITYEIADMIETLEAVKLSRFTELVGDDFLIIDHNNNEYITSYEDGYLRATDINGDPLSGNLNETILRKANLELSMAIQQEINKLKTKLNETNATNGVIASPITTRGLMSPEASTGESAQNAERRQESEINTANRTSNSKPGVKQTQAEESEQARLIEIQERVINENEIESIQAEILFAEPTVESAKFEQAEIVESTTNTESGQTTKEQERLIITNNAPTESSYITLNNTFPKAWSQQFIAIPTKDRTVAPKGYLTIRDGNGNLIPVYSNTNGSPYVIKNAKDMTDNERRLLSEGSERVKTIHYYAPRVDSNNKVIQEGERIIESQETLKQYSKDGEMQVISIKEDSVKESDIIDFKLANSPEVGVGTKVILRVEPNNKYYTPSTQERESMIVVTVRLASNPSIVLAKLLRGDNKHIQNAKLRAKIETAFNGERSADIEATIAGKTNGFVINKKEKGGNSLQQPISVLGPKLILGVHQGEQGIVFNNTNTPSYKSAFSENGYVYGRVKSASGRFVPVRLETNTLSVEAAEAVLSILTNDSITAKDKQSLVNQIVHVPLGLRKDDNFRLGGKFAKILAMDNFVLKIPFREGQVIGIQYNMEGSENFKRNNLLNALEDKEFFFKQYDQEGNLVSGPGPVVGSTETSVQRNSLISSKGLELQPGQIRDAIMQHLASKVYHVEKHKINTDGAYFSPLQSEPYTSYLDYLSTANILTTDIPGGGQQQFHHSAIYVKTSDTIIEASNSDVPGFLKGKVEVMGTPEIIVEEEQRPQQTVLDLFGESLPDEMSTQQISELDKKLLDAELDYLEKTFGKEMVDVYFQGIETLPEKNQKELNKIRLSLRSAQQSSEVEGGVTPMFEIINKEFTTEDSLFPTATNKQLGEGMRALYDSGVPVKLAISNIDPNNISLGSPIQDADVDMVSFSLSIDGNNIGLLVVNAETNVEKAETNQIVNVEILPEFRGLGLGTKLYKAAAAELGGLKSDPSFLSTKAENIWKSLVKQGVAVKTTVKAEGANAGYAMSEVMGLNAKLDSYGLTTLVIPGNYFEGGRPKGRLNSFKSSIKKVSDNLQILADLNLSEFDFLSSTDLQRLEALKPKVKRFIQLNMDISSNLTRTNIKEQEFVKLNNEILNEFVDIINPHVKTQLGKNISVSQPAVTRQTIIKEANPNIDTEFKLRQYEELEGNTPLITEEEGQWFLSRFGEEGLTVMDRIKYITLKDGRQAYGFYHKGMVTIAEEAKTGTLYWEAFRRIYDLHLTSEEKSTIEMEIISRGDLSLQTQDIETRLANEFMRYKLNQDETGLGATIKKFFRELLYYIKNLLSSKNSIEKLFRDINTREFTKYTAQEAAKLSEVNVPLLREKVGFSSEQAIEIVGNINFQLKRALENKYGERWLDELAKPQSIRNVYESLRQHYVKLGDRLKTGATENLRMIGKNYEEISKPNIWYDVKDQYENITSPGFLTLAIKELQPQFGIKYKITQGGEIAFNKAPIVQDGSSELNTEENITDTEELGTETKQHIFNINYFNTPIKDTLSKDIKVMLSFIQSPNKGEMLGEYSFLPFDEVYSYLSVALANTPGGDVIGRLTSLAEEGSHPLVKQVVSIYGETTKQNQNKFVSHFNKQNIQFKTLIIDEGQVKIVFTNRNGLEKQIINEWIDNRGETELYIPTTGKPDLINTTAVEQLDRLYVETSKQAKLGNKLKYLRAFKNTLDYAGIELGNEVYRAMASNDAMTISNINSYMVGNRSFEHILRGLKRNIPTSPYLAGNAEISTLRRLAGLAAKFKIDNYNASFLSGAKKPIYAINLNTYDSKITLELRSDETYQETILNRFRDTFYSPTPEMRHLILDMLLNNDEVRANFQLSTFDVIKDKGNSGKATAYDHMNQLLSAQTRFSMFFNSGLEFGDFNTGTKGDKTQSKYITLPKISPDGRFNSKLWKSGNDRSYNGWVKTGVELLKPAVYGELARISKVNKQLFGNNPIALDEQIQNIHYREKPGDNQGNGLRFIAFPALNNPEYNFFATNGRLIQVYENIDSMATIEQQRIDISDALNKYVKNNINSTLGALVEAGAIEKGSDGKYVNTKLPEMALQGKTLNNDISPALIEFAVNDLVYKPYINTVFGPDLAYYKTDATGNPLIDAGKRAYQSVTPGIDSVWNEEKQYGLPNKFSHAILADVIKNQEKDILDILLNAKVEPKTAKRISAAYRKVNATDAQGFTTLAFHRMQMESDGSWTEAHTDAYNKYWSKGLMGDAASRTLLLDPRKTYYYGERVITDSQGNESIVWEQIKHSTIPLLREFTELYKETPTDSKVTLNQLRIRMERKDNPIDMVNFESALKIGASGIMNYENGNLDTIKVNFLDSKNLRSPQIVKTKTGSNLDGTQMAKLGLANILDTANYNVFGESISGKELKSLYNEIYGERIKRSHDQLVKELGIKAYQEANDNRVEIGEAEFTKQQLRFLQSTRDLIINSLDERSLPDNYYLALNIQELVNDIENVGYESPLSFPPFAKRFESILLSLFKNRILKQRFNGMSVVQVAEFGYEIDSALKMKSHENGGVYAEVALPYEMVVKMGLKPGDIVDSSDVFDLIGYRIPTQGKNSMLSLRVVRILPENMGGVIMMPAEITTMMGSDFDVDKLYLMFPELSKNKNKINAFSFEKFELGKSTFIVKEFEGLSDEAITNALFDIRNSVVTSKNHVAEILDPLDSPTYQTKLDEYTDLGIVQNLDGMNINSFAADMYLEKINKDASMLIGLFSLQATGHAMAQQMDVSLRDDSAIHIKAEGKDSHTSLSRIEGFDKKFISSYLSEDQNESLDNAKYQRIGRVGVTVYNSGVVGLLNRVGFNNSVTLDFLNQPIMREFFKRRYKADPSVMDITIAKDMAKELDTSSQFTEMQYKDVRLFTPSANSLSESLTELYENEENRIPQTQILSDFLKYTHTARDLTKFNNAVSPETLKNTSRLSFFERYNQNVEYLNSQRSSINIGNSTARLDAYRQYGINAAVNFTSEFIPYNKPGFIELKNNIATLTGQRDNRLTPELTDTVNGMGLYWSLTKKESPFGNTIYEKNEALRKALFTSEGSLLASLNRIKRENGLTNDPFLGMLFGHENNIGIDNHLQTIAFNNTAKLSPSQLNLITDRWAELLQDPRSNVRTLAQNLVKYAVITSGFMLSPNSFVDLVPISYWQSSGLTDYFRKEARTMGYENYFDGNASEQIIRNMFTDQGFLMNIDATAVATDKELRRKQQMGDNEYFLHKAQSPQLLVDNQMDSNEQGYVNYFKSFIGGKFRLFKFKHNTGTGGIYQEITPLGTRFRHVEMQADNIEVESMNPNNTLLNKETNTSEVRTLKEITDESAGEQTNGNFMPRLTPIVKEAVLADLDIRIESWLMENFASPVNKYNNLKSKLGVDAIGVADMVNRVIEVDNTRDRYTLPEEAGHFYVEMMENPAMERLLNLVAQTRTYQDVLKKYDKIYDNELMFKKEAAGQILGKFIVGSYTGQAVTEDYGEGLIGTLKQVWNSIMRFFNRIGLKESLNGLNEQLTEVLGPAAAAIIEGVNPGGLSVENIGINKYYALQKPSIEFRDSDGKVVTIKEQANSLFKRVNRSASSKIPYLRKFTQKDSMDMLIAESNQIIEPTESNNYYQQDGVNLNRVSNVLEIFQDPFNQQLMADKIANINIKEGDPFNTSDKVLALWDFLRDDMGTGLHNILQGLIDKSDMDSIINSIPEGQREAFRTAIPQLRAWVSEKEGAGSTLYAETKIGDKTDLIGGAVDIIEVTSDGRKNLWDLKTKVAGKFANLEKKFPNFKGALSGIENTLFNKYRLQLSLYKHIIEEKGISVDSINILPLEADVNIDDNGTITFSKVSLSNDNLQSLNKLTNMEPIKRKIIKNVVSYVSPETDEAGLEQQKEADTLLRVFNKAKAQIQRKVGKYKKEAGSTEYSEALEVLLTELDEITEKEGLVLYTKRAVRDITSAYSRLKILQKNNSLNPRVLNQIRDFVAVYDSLDEITLMAPLLAESGYENILEKYVQPAIAKRELVKTEVNALMRPLIAETLGKLSKNPDMSIQQLEAELLIASRDISGIARWMDALGDSKDTTLAMINKIISIQRTKVREQSMNLMHGTKGTTALMDLMTNLEKYQHANGINMWNNREVYNFMLEENNKGELTGKIVNKYIPEFKVLKDKFMADNEHLSRQDWNAFYDVHNPEDFLSAKFKAVEGMHKDDPRKAFYDFFKTNYDYAQSVLPSSYQRGKMLPSLRATPAERAIETKGKNDPTWFFGKPYEYVKESLGGFFVKQEDNISFGEYVGVDGNPLDYVPVHYSKAIGAAENQLSPELVSYDLGSILQQYYTMAMNFNEMSQILPELEGALELVRTRRVSKLKAGMPIIDQAGEEVTLSGEDSKAYQRLYDYFQMQVYGKRKKSTGSVSINGNTLELAQISDAMLQLGSLRVLAMNKHAALSNVTFGMLMTWIEAFANDQFGVGNFTKAKTIYYGGLKDMGSPGLISDVLARTPQSKIGLVNEAFDVLQEFDEYGTRLQHRQLGLRMNTGALYFMMSAGEHMIQTQMAISMMLNTKFETSKGEVNLWDAYSVVNKKLVLNPEVASQFDTQARAEMSEKIHATYQRIHGIYNSKDASALQQYAAGRWAIQFRKWLRPGMLRRFEGGEKLFYNKDSKFKKADFNERLESYVEGNYVTTVKFFEAIRKDMFGLQFNTMKSQYQKLEPWQQANLRRALGEGMGLMLLYTLSGLFGYDEDDEDGAANMTAFDWQMLYNIKRVQSELKFYNPLGSSFYEILRTPAANMTSIEAYGKLAAQIWSDAGNILVGNDFDRYKRKTGAYEKGDAKIRKRIRNTLFFKEFFSDPKDKMKFFDL